MNIVMTQGAVKVSKVGEQKPTGDSRIDDKKTEMGRALVGNENNNAKTVGPKLQTDNERKLGDLMEMNGLLKKQLESRDTIIKKQISEIHRLQGQNKLLSEEKSEIAKANENLKKDCEAEQWLSERLKHDIRDLQMQLDFQDCYLQEQAHQSNLMSNLMDELQNKNDAQAKEITELRKQLQSGKEKVDNQIENLQKMLGIQSKMPTK